MANERCYRVNEHKKVKEKTPCEVFLFYSRRYLIFSNKII